MTCALCLLICQGAMAQHGTAGPNGLTVPDAGGAIVLDGAPVERAWVGAARITTFYEVWPGDNVAPPVRTTVALTYDSRDLYIGVWAQDPHPERLRAAYADRDNVSEANDYISFVLDTRGDGRTGTVVRISPRGVQADGIFNDALFAVGQPEDFAPDFAWDAATAVSDSGWTAEIRVPFASLRYPARERQRWGLIVHRHYPRDFPYELFSVHLPRGGGCFLCREQWIELSGLPTSAYVQAAPYVSMQADRAAGGLSAEPTAGGDLKWAPGAGTVFDATLRPDFSQIESDVPQIGVNAQFALLYPEKRPFFLEGADLFQTPLQAASTRAVTAPAWGARATGQLGASAYTLLVARDRGGGSVILPGAAASGQAPQDFASTVVIARERTSWRRGFAGLLGTAREIAAEGGGGYNRVLGPDFQWNPGSADQLTGQLLASDTRLPSRPDLTAAWDGRSLFGAAADLAWHHGDRRFEWRAEYRDIANDFRADDGFLPQVGVRFADAWANTNVYRTGVINQVQPWVRFRRVVDRSGALVSEWRYAGLALAGARGLNLVVRYSDERLRAAGAPLPRRYALVALDAFPGARLAELHLTARYGGDVDVTNGRTGRGGELSASVLAHPNDHLELQGLATLSWLDLPIGGAARRLFTARVARLRATYHFTTRAALRVIAQDVRTARDSSLYYTPVAAREGGATLSALLSYRWSWETAAFLGLGDAWLLSDTETPAPQTQTLFFKLQVGVW